MGTKKTYLKSLTNEESENKLRSKNEATANLNQQRKRAAHCTYTQSPMVFIFMGDYRKHPIRPDRSLST